MKTKMKTTLFLSMLTIAIGFSACTKDSPDPLETAITETVTELNASDYLIDQDNGSLSGPFIKFNFSLADTVSGDTPWDVAFRGTTIIVNGGEPSHIDQPDRDGNAAVYIIPDTTMSGVTEVDESSFLQDNATSLAIIDDYGFTGIGWCSYAGPPTHLITPIAGKILVFRTHDNKYAKVEILNFYDSPMTNPFGGFYTFNYVYQSDGATNF